MDSHHERRPLTIDFVHVLLMYLEVKEASWNQSLV